MSRYPSSISHLDTINPEAFRRHFEYWRYWNPDFHLPKRCSRLHFVNKKLNLDCKFEAWFRIWIPNTQSRLRVQKHYYILWIKNLTSIACLKHGFAFEYQILNRGFVFNSIASLCEYILTCIACLKHGFTNTESIEAWCSKVLLHFVNKTQKRCFTLWIKN